MSDVLAGPTLGPLLELGIVNPLSAAKGRIEGKETHFLAKEAQGLKGFVPGGNVWYAKAALDHMVFNKVFEMLSPGYLETVRSRTLKNTGQEFWWRPGEIAPERAPDLGKITAP